MVKKIAKGLGFKLGFKSKKSTPFVVAQRRVRKYRKAASNPNIIIQLCEYITDSLALCIVNESLSRISSVNGGQHPKGRGMMRGIDNSDKFR